MKKFTSILWLALLAGGLLLYAQVRPAYEQPQGKFAAMRPLATTPTLGTPSIGLPDVTPAYLFGNLATTVTVSIQITDPTLIPNSVNLLRLSDSDGTATVIAAMPNAGANTYIATTSISAPTGNSVVLEVSAAFKGLLKRIVSPPFTLLSVSSPLKVFSSSDLHVSFSYPDNFVLSSTGQDISLTDFQPSDFGGLDVGGCEIDISLNLNSSQMTLSNWITANWRSDGTNAPVLVGGHAGIEKDFVDDISGDPATMIAVSAPNDIYSYSTVGSSCSSVMWKILSDTAFN